VFKAVHKFDFRLVINEIPTKWRPVESAYSARYLYFWEDLYIFLWPSWRVLRGLYPRCADWLRSLEYETVPNLPEISFWLHLTLFLQGFLPRLALSPNKFHRASSCFVSGVVIDDCLQVGIWPYRKRVRVPGVKRPIDFNLLKPSGNFTYYQV
jgi:hypothetical protein